MQHTQDCLSSALGLATHGFKVFPVKRDKSPYTQHGFHDASTQEETIQAWWQRWPDAGIGLPVPENMLIIDIDEDRGGTAQAVALGSFLDIKDLTVITKTPHGYHFWFLLPDGLDPSTLKGTTGVPGVDVRLPEKHYVLVPPSLNGSGNYDWVGRARPWSSNVGPTEVPSHILTLLTKPESVPVAQSLVTFPQSHVDRLLSQAVETVSTGQETRNVEGLWLACQCRDSGLSREETEPVMLAYAAQVQSYGDHAYTSEEVLKTIRSAYSRPSREPAHTLLTTSAEPSVPFYSLPFTSVRFTSIPFLSATSNITGEMSMSKTREEVLELMEKVDAMDSSGSSRLPGPAQDRFRAQFYIFKTIWATHFPTWPLSRTTFSTWRGLIVQTLGVGMEGGDLLSVLFAFLDAPHPRGILHPLAAIEAAIRDSVGLDQRTQAQRPRRMAQLRDMTQPQQPEDIPF